MAIQERNAELVNLLECDFVRNNGELHLSTVAVVANYAANKYTVMLVTTGALDRTITLPTAALNVGKVYVVKKVDAGVGVVRVTPTAPDLIDGLASYIVGGQYDSNMFVSDGTNWWFI